jgi:hypothetical protein
MPEFPVTSVLRIGWPALPCPPTPFGTGNKRHCCVGCHLSLSASPCVILCSFSDDGFPFLDGSPAHPCHSVCHTGCFSASPLFVSRQENGAGLTFPKVKTWPNFVCEACIVHAMVDCELTGPLDWKLAALLRTHVDPRHGSLLGIGCSWQTPRQTQCHVPV